MHIFLTIVLPLLKTSMAALGIFIFLGQWNFFFYPLTFLNTSENFTLPLVVNQFKAMLASDWGALMAGVTLSALPMLIVFVIAQRQIPRASRSRDPRPDLPSPRLRQGAGCGQVLRLQRVYVLRNRPIGNARYEWALRREYSEG